MSRRRWVLVVFVATVVCNGNCRPREVDIENVYPVYRSVKELELETPSRYEKPFKDSRGDDSVTYLRIDIPYKNVNGFNATEALAVKNNSKSVIDYVPVALTVKRPNIKKWPSDQNGIQSSDDLSLYNDYTSNINPLNPHHMTTPGYNSHSRPSILILEELTTRKPLYDSVHTQPIQVLDRPPEPPPIYPVHVVTSKPNPVQADFSSPHWPIYRPTPPHVPEYPPYPLPPPYEHQFPTPEQPPPSQQPSYETPAQVSSTLHPEITTKKKYTRCPSVLITSTTSINNKHSLNKEGCQDISIQISTNVSNSNTVLVRPTRPANSPPVFVQNRPTSSSGIFGVFDVIWTIFSSSTPSTAEPKSVNENPAKTNTKLDIESIATVARASSDGPSLPSPSALGHMLDTVSQMVESDIRTPPKLKEIIKEKTNDQRKEALGELSTPLPYTFIYDDELAKHEVTDKTLLVDSSEGKASNANVKITTDEGVKGIAIPVVMDDEYEPTAPPKKLQKIPEVPKPAKEDKKKNSVTKAQLTTTPSSGLSTWILLSDNKDFTTPSPKKNINKKDEEKKKGSGTTTKKPPKVQPTTQKTSTTQASKKVTIRKPETEPTAMSALEALVKNQKKGSATTVKPKTGEESKPKKPATDPKKKFPDRLEVAETKDKIEVELPESKTTYTLPPNLQITTEEKLVTPMSTQSRPKTTTESSLDSTTKKKTTSKKKKKNKNRRKKPAEGTELEAKIPPQPVGSQIYNFLSREIVPTVGLGLIGVALTAGLASFLGYNPFGSSTVPLRRTYDTHHGYSPNNYYNYNTDYGGGGQSEEVLFREVLSGMPEESRYDMTHADTSYHDAYKRQDQMYETMKNPVYPTGMGTSYSEKDIGNYDASYSQDYSTVYGTTYDTQDKKYSNGVKDNYSVYNRETGTSFVYPETTGMTSADKNSRVNEDYATQSSTGDKYPKPSGDTIERQPEALYRVAGESELQYRNGESTIEGVSSQNSWHRIGSPMEAKKSYPHLEPGPRSLKLAEEPAKKRTKRDADSVIQRISRKRSKKENDVENEIDFDDTLSDDRFQEQNLLRDESTTATASKTTTISAETTATPDIDISSTTVTTTEEVKEASSAEPTEAYDADNESTAPHPGGVSVLDVLKRLAQFKLRLGLNFLRTTTDLFSRYLDDIQRRVDESFANSTTTTVQYNRRKSPWSRIFFSRLNDDDDSYRRKRSVLEENHFLSAMLADEGKERFSKSTKKDLRLSNKIFHKKQAPKKYESTRTN